MSPQPEAQTNETRKGCKWEEPTQELEEDDNNMLIHLEWHRLRKEFSEYLENEIPTIEVIVAQHLNLRSHQTCRVAERSQWLDQGTFNLCVPVFINNWRARRVLIRNHPRVPIPHLWGFGLPGGLRFSPLEHAPWYQRALVSLKHCWSWVIRRSYFQPFVPCQSHVSLKSGYLVMEFFEEERGRMLSAVERPTAEHRRTLFRSFREILLDLSRPLSMIGSFTVHDSGEVSLGNRPLTRGLAVLENAGVPTQIPRDYCYSSTDSYLLDLLDCHDQRLIHQPNAARSDLDLEGQMATIVALRALYSRFRNSPLQRKPPFFQFTDLHESNFFVDKDYHITGIVDIEWSCVLPMEMQHPPFWLSGHELDDLYGEGTRENEQEFERACEEFLQILEEDNEGEKFSIRPRDYAQAMRDSLRRKQHWYMAAVRIPPIAYSFFLYKIQPLFAFAHSEEDAGIFQDVVAKYWRVDTMGFFEQKRREWSDYLRQLRSMQSLSSSIPA